MSKKPVDPPAGGKGKAKPRAPQDAAFRRWLEGQLHDKYDAVLNEPIPDDLLSVLKPETPAQPDDNRPDDKAPKDDEAK